MIKNKKIIVSELIFLLVLFGVYSFNYSRAMEKSSIYKWDNELLVERFFDEGTDSQDFHQFLEMEIIVEKYNFKVPPIENFLDNIVNTQTGSNMTLGELMNELTSFTIKIDFSEHFYRNVYHTGRFVWESYDQGFWRVSLSIDGEYISGDIEAAGLELTKNVIDTSIENHGIEDVEKGLFPKSIIFNTSNLSKEPK